jgi:pimeloyl-ACP methyl ester carboxylesterase
MSSQILSSGTLLTSDKQKISFQHYRKGFSTVVIIAHGFYNSKDSELLQNLAYACAAYDVFLFDFRGHGKSSGLFSWTSKEGRDFNAVLDYLKPLYKNIGVIAFSLGASIVINVLSERCEVSTLVCVSGPSDLSKIDYQFWKLDWKEDVEYTLFSKQGKQGKGVRPGPFWLKKRKPLRVVSKIKVPILYIHGEKDWVVKPWHSQVLYDRTRAKKKMVLIPDGAHAEYLMKTSAHVFVQEVQEWFQETLNGGE